MVAPKLSTLFLCLTFIVAVIGYPVVKTASLSDVEDVLEQLKDKTDTAKEVTGITRGFLVGPVHHANGKAPIKPKYFDHVHGDAHGFYGGIPYLGAYAGLGHHAAMIGHPHHPYLSDDHNLGYGGIGHGYHHNHYNQGVSVDHGDGLGYNVYTPTHGHDHGHGHISDHGHGHVHGIAPSDFYGYNDGYNYHADVGGVNYHHGFGLHNHEHQTKNKNHAPVNQGPHLVVNPDGIHKHIAGQGQYKSKIIRKKLTKKSHLKRKVKKAAKKNLGHSHYKIIKNKSTEKATARNYIGHGVHFISDDHGCYHGNGLNGAENLCNFHGLDEMLPDLNHIPSIHHPAVKSPGAHSHFTRYGGINPANLWDPHDQHYPDYTGHNENVEQMLDMNPGVHVNKDGHLGLGLLGVHKGHEDVGVVGVHINHDAPVQDLTTDHGLGIGHNIVHNIHKGHAFNTGLGSHSNHVENEVHGPEINKNIDAVSSFHTDGLLPGPSHIPLGHHPVVKSPGVHSHFARYGGVHPAGVWDPRRHHYPDYTGHIEHVEQMIDMNPGVHVTQHGHLGLSLLRGHKGHESVGALGVHMNHYAPVQDLTTTGLGLGHNVGHTLNVGHNINKGHLFHTGFDPNINDIESDRHWDDMSQNINPVSGFNTNFDNSDISYAGIEPNFEGHGDFYASHGRDGYTHNLRPDVFHGFGVHNHPNVALHTEHTAHHLPVHHVFVKDPSPQVRHYDGHSHHADNYLGYVQHHTGMESILQGDDSPHEENEFENNEYDDTVSGHKKEFVGKFFDNFDTFHPREKPWWTW